MNIFEFIFMYFAIIGIALLGLNFIAKFENDEDFRNGVIIIAIIVLIIIILANIP